MIDRYAIDPGTVLDGAILLGGSPRRVLRLSRTALSAYGAIVHHAQLDRTARQLAARLTRDGLIHPEPPNAPVEDVTIVIPVRDRALELDRCLRAIGATTAAPTIVVDDGSLDPDRIAKVAQAHHAALIALPTNRGPAAARNAGAQAALSSLVAFVDSDVEVRRGWLEALLGHFADPDVAAVAPRIVGMPAISSTVTRLIAHRSPLDLGPQAAPVIAMSRVSYVPSAALIMRRDCASFDPDLRYGEDVDLIWRLIEAGRQIRYEPRSVVHHLEPSTVRAWVERRYHYGSSAAPLDVRHPGLVRPLVLDPLPTGVGLLLAIGRWRLGIVGYALAVAHTYARRQAAGIPANRAVGDTARSVLWALSMSATWILQFAGPALPAAILAAVRAPDRRRLSILAILLVVPVVADRRTQRAWYPERSYTVADVIGMVADRAAYGAGVWGGAIRWRRPAVIMPKILAIPRIRRR